MSMLYRYLFYQVDGQLICSLWSKAKSKKQIFKFFLNVQTIITIKLKRYAAGYSSTTLVIICIGFIFYKMENNKKQKMELEASFKIYK